MNAKEKKQKQKRTVREEKSQNNSQGLIFLQLFHPLVDRTLELWDHPPAVHSRGAWLSAQLQSRPDCRAQIPGLDSLLGLSNPEQVMETLCASVFSSIYIKWGWEHIFHGVIARIHELTHINFLHFTNGETEAQREITGSSHIVSDC